MGLETVELVMEIEDEFGIRISDEAAEKVWTIGDSFKCVMNLLARKGRLGYCASAVSFYRLRRDLIHTYGLPRTSIRPDKAIGDLIPEGQGRYQWKDVARRCELPVPRARFFHPLSSRFPEPVTTIRQLLLAKGPAAIRRADGSIDPEAVWQRLRVIVSEQAGVRLEELTADTSYVDDLRMD